MTMNGRLPQRSTDDAMLDLERQKCRVRAAAAGTRERPQGPAPSDAAGRVLDLAAKHPGATAGIVFGVVAVFGLVRVLRVVILAVHAGAAIASIASTRVSNRRP